MTEKKSNIVFIGMPGAGKSTVGVVIAKVLRYAFLDSDILIQEQEGDILENLIKKHGIEGFLEIENRVNREICVEKTVISTGGSVCYCSEAMEHLRETGLVVYLKLDLETIDQRAGDLDRRGVVMKNGNTLRDLYVERTALYEKYADLTVDLAGCSITESIEVVRKALEATI